MTCVHSLLLLWRRRIRRSRFDVEEINAVEQDLDRTGVLPRSKERLSSVMTARRRRLRMQNPKQTGPVDVLASRQQGGRHPGPPLPGVKAGCRRKRTARLTQA